MADNNNKKNIYLYVIIAATAIAAVAGWGKDFFFDAQKFFDREHAPYKRRLECVEKKSEDNQQLIIKAGERLTRIETTLDNIDKKLQ